MQPEYRRAKSHPEYRARARQFLAVSNPVDPKELTRRLETWLLEEETRKLYNLPRPVKKVQTSSKASPVSIKSHRSASVSSRSAPIQPQSSIPLSNSQDTFARIVKFNKQQARSDAIRTQQTDTQKSDIRLAKSTDPHVSVDYPLPAAVRTTGKAEVPTARTKQLQQKVKFPKPPLEPRDAPTASKSRGERPKSLPYVPRYAGRSMVLTATPDPVKRESVHLLSQQVLNAYQKPSFRGHAINTQSTLKSSVAEPTSSALAKSLSFSESSQSTDASPTKDSHTSSPDYPSTGSTSRQSPIPPNQTALFKNGSNGARPKTWIPQNLVAAVKVRNEAHDQLMGRNNFQTTSVRMDAAEDGRSRTVLHEAATLSKERTADSLNARGGSKRKKTAFEDIVALGNKQGEQPNKPVEDIPVIIQPGERRPGVCDWAQESSDDEATESLIRRISRRLSRRRSTGEGETREEVHIAREGVKQGSKRDKLRRKQLAMLQNALEVSKDSEGGRKDWEQLPSQRRSPVSATTPQDVDDHPLRSHPAGDMLLENFQDNPSQPLAPEPTPPSSLPKLSPLLHHDLPPSPPPDPLLDVEVDLSLGSSKLDHPQGRDPMLKTSPKNHEDAQFEQKSNSSAPPPIHRTQTEPIPPHVHRNDLATLPSQRIAATHYYTPPSRSFTQPLERTKTEAVLQLWTHPTDFPARPKSFFHFDGAREGLDTPTSRGATEKEKRHSMFPSAPNKHIIDVIKQERPGSRGLSERRKSIFASGSADLDQARLQTCHKERRKSGFGSTDTSQSKTSERPKTVDSSKRKSFFGGGGDKILRPGTQQSQSSELPFERTSQHARKTSNGTQTSLPSVQNFSHQRSRSWARPVVDTDTGKEVAIEVGLAPRTSSRTESVKTVRPSRSLGPIDGSSTVPMATAFELDQMTSESIDLLRNQERLLRRMTSTSSVINIGIAPGIEVPFGVAFGRIGASTASGTPGDQTPIFPETVEIPKQSIPESRRKTRQSRFVETSSLFRGKSRMRRDSEAAREEDEEDGLNIQKRRDRLAVERVGAGSKAVSMPDLLEQVAGKEKKRSKWKFWKKT